MQSSPQAGLTLVALSLSGTDPLAIRASRKLRGDERYLTRFAPVRIRMPWAGCRPGAVNM
ncbi:MAG: hypothetical protein KDI83_05375 [Gammaproteobacteria bacterium]|nr:hypothetical protein [Gammaproteobacteria bacterium]